MLSFVEALKVARARAFSTQGRSSRSEYWWLTLALVIVSFVLSLIAIIPVLGVIIYLVGSIILAVLSIAVGIRRLHDRNLTGWLIILAFVPLANIVLLVLFCLPGTKGPNKYGDDPLTTPNFYTDFLKKGGQKFSMDELKSLKDNSKGSIDQPHFANQEQNSANEQSTAKENNAEATATTENVAESKDNVATEPASTDATAEKAEKAEKAENQDTATKKD